MNQDRHVAIVTGGNRGIGHEICKELSRADCNVVLTSRNEEEGRRAVAKLHHHDNVAYRRLDVTDSKDIASLRDWILKTYGRVDILINNAGVYLDSSLDYLYKALVILINFCHVIIFKIVELRNHLNYMKNLFRKIKLGIS